jgi:hypothetical protein
MVLLERALENFWQKSARDYDKREHEKPALAYWRKRGVNRSRRQKFSARGSETIKNRPERKN